MIGQPSRALLVTPISPWGESFGGQQRTALLYESINELFQVDVLLLTEGAARGAVSGERAEIVAKLTWKQGIALGGNFWADNWATRWCNENVDWSRYACVVGRYLTPMSKIKWPSNLPTIVDCDDAYYRYVPSFPGRVGQVLAAARGKVRYWRARRAISAFDHAFFCSASDKALFDCRSSSILPNVAVAPSRLSAYRECKFGVVLIVGSLWYPPNREGVDWFVDRCWPSIAARCTDLRLRIVGPASLEKRQQWARAERTEAPGFVEDIGAEYRQAMFTVAPINYGGGSCIKFLESAAYGKACIATQQVIRGFDGNFLEGHSALSARNQEEMIEACVSLYNDANRRELLAARASEIVRNSYSEQRFKNAAKNAVLALIQRKKAA